VANTRRHRRGLSTVIGAVFMILVTVGALNVVLWTLQQQNRVAESLIEKSNSNLNKLNEDIEISNVRVDGDKLNMTVTNTGGAAATIKSVYIINETASEQYRYDLDLVVDGRESQKDVGQTLPLIIKDDTRYSVRLITESGNTVTTNISPLSAVAFPMQLYLIPPTPTPGENITALFAVTNNLTDSELAGDVDLKLYYSLGCTPSPEACYVEKHVEPVSNITTIGKGNTALFKWVFEVKAPDETYITFNASLANAREGNYEIEKALIKVVDTAQTSFASEIVVSSSLVQKPELFLMLPNPFGDSSDQGLVGVVVANPTGNTMTVSRIVINTYSSKPTGAGGNELLPSPCTTDITQVYPTSGWSCPHANMIEWKDIDTPEPIEGLEAQTFLLKIKPDDISDPEPAFTVAVAVFTNLGQFTKIGYSGGMDSNSLSLANVYMTDSIDAGEVVQDSHILGNVSNLEPGVTRRFNVTVADLDASSSTYIDDGTKLIINVPRGFTGVTVQSYTGFNLPQVVPYGDGTTQIIATLSQDVGDQGSKEGKTISFDAVPPIPDPVAQRIYILYALLDGTADSTGVNGATDFSVGAIAEMALVVNES
jgi:archaellum component FlaF (FlaF/FlaG flagellin family)